jgi:hypothetical protein
MKVKFIDDKWRIEVFTKELGNVFLLNPQSELPIPIQFETESEALAYMNGYRRGKEEWFTGEKNDDFYLSTETINRLDDLGEEGD